MGEPTGLRQAAQDTQGVVNRERTIPVGVGSQLIGGRLCIPLRHLEDGDGVLHIHDAVSGQVTQLTHGSRFNECDGLYFPGTLDADEEGCRNADPTEEKGPQELP